MFAAKRSVWVGGASVLGSSAAFTPAVDVFVWLFLFLFIEELTNIYIYSLLAVFPESSFLLNVIIFCVSFFSTLPSLVWLALPPCMHACITLHTRVYILFISI